MASFSSRGPTGDWIKPDVTAPGVQVLAGMTPQPDQTTADNGPPGNLYQAIAGTSMSSPHAAGVSLLVKAAHPTWTPEEIKSALMTSSVQTVVKEDGVTPADSVRRRRRLDPRRPRGEPDARLQRDVRRLRRRGHRPAAPGRPEPPEHRRNDDARRRSRPADGDQRLRPASRTWTSRRRMPAGVDDHGRQQQSRRTLHLTREGRDASTFPIKIDATAVAERPVLRLDQADAASRRATRSSCRSPS